MLALPNAASENNLDLRVVPSGKPRTLSTLFYDDEELRVPADRPADADPIAPVRGDLQRQEEEAAAEEVGSVSREEPLLLRRTDYFVPAKRRPPSHPRPYCRHLWPFLCFRVSHLLYI